MSSKGINSASKQMINYEFSSTSKRHDSTISCITHPFVLLTDWELEVSFGYNDYLQAVIMKQLVTEGIKKKKIDINLQLSEKADQLNEAREEVGKLELKTLLMHLTNTIKAFAGRFTDQLSPDVETALNELILALQNAEQNLYLKNVKPLESEEEMFLFNELLVILKNTMEKTIMLIPNTEMYHKHACLLNEYKELARELIYINSYVLKLNNNNNSTLLKVLFDNLSEFEDY